jgi:hypothetical protein
MMVEVWTALAVETGAAVIISGMLVAWARRRFAPDRECAAEPSE